MEMDSRIFSSFFLFWIVVPWSCHCETCNSGCSKLSFIGSKFDPDRPWTDKVTNPTVEPTDSFKSSRRPQTPPNPPVVRPPAPANPPVTDLNPPAGQPPTTSLHAYPPAGQPPTTSLHAYPPAGQPLTTSSGVHNPNRKLKIIIGVSAGCFSLIVGLLYGMLIYIRRRRRLSNKTLSTFKKKIMSMESIMNDRPKRYHYSEIKKMTNSFSDKIGEGGYGIVYRGKLDNGTLIAVKVLKVSKSDGDDFINEVMSNSKTSHVNIVSLLGFSYNSKKIALMYEFMSNGSLDSFISRSHTLEIKTIHQIVEGVAKGLEYLHCGCSTRIVHFDIKPQNILLDEDFNPKISDFGLAKLCKRKESMISMLGARGTAGFIAPEVFSRSFGIVSYKSDVYSYGMLVLDLVLGGTRNPSSKFLSDDSEMYFPSWIFKKFEADQTVRTSQSLTEEEEEMEKKMVMVGLWCIQTSPSDRPSMSRVLEMLGGSIHSLQMPPKPSLVPPKMSTQHSTSESLSSQEVV